MDYRFEMTLPYGEPAMRRRAAEAGRRAFEDALGGRKQALLLALDLLAEGCDYVDVFTGDYKTASERRWGEAVRKAHEAALTAALPAAVQDLASADGFLSEYLEHAHLDITPLVDAPYHREEPWIDAYLTRLHELRFEALELMTARHGKLAHDNDGSTHPIWCADKLFIQIQMSNEVERRPHPVGQHRWFQQLRSDLGAAVAGHQAAVPQR